MGVKHDHQVQRTVRTVCLKEIRHLVDKAQRGRLVGCTRQRTIRGSVTATAMWELQHYYCKEVVVT